VQIKGSLNLAHASDLGFAGEALSSKASSSVVGSEVAASSPAGAPRVLDNPNGLASASLSLPADTENLMATEVLSARADLIDTRTHIEEVVVSVECHENGTIGGDFSLDVIGLGHDLHGISLALVLLEVYLGVGTSKGALVILGQVGSALFGNGSCGHEIINDGNFISTVATLIFGVAVNLVLGGDDNVSLSARLNAEAVLKHRGTGESPAAAALSLILNWVDAAGGYGGRETPLSSAIEISRESAIGLAVGDELAHELANISGAETEAAESLVESRDNTVGDFRAEAGFLLTASKLFISPVLEGVIFVSHGGPGPSNLGELSDSLWVNCAVAGIDGHNEADDGEN